MHKFSLNNDTSNLILLSLLAITVCIPGLMWGFPHSHDILNALIGFKQFSEQIWNGEFYPRWLNNLYNGYGAPMFYYYTPLPFYIATFVDFFSFNTISDRMVLGLTACLMFIAAAISCYIWLSDILDTKKALIGATVYTLAPYHLVIDFYIRGSLTELFAYVWIPLILFFIRYSFFARFAWIWLALCYCLLILSSVPIAILMTPFFIIYASHEAYLSLQKRSAHQHIYKIHSFLGLIFGFGLAGFYIVTAYLMSDFIHAEKFWSGFYDPLQWFLCPFDCSDKTLPDFMNKISWVVAVQAALIFACFATTYKSGKINKQRYVFWAIMATGSLFMMSGLSRLLWEHLPLLAKTQFPWRLSIILDLCLAFFIARKFPFSWKASEKEYHVSLVLACLLFSFSLNNLMNVSYETPKKNQLEIKEALSDGKYLGVYFPTEANVTLDNVMNWKKRETVASFQNDDFSEHNITYERIPYGYTIELGDVQKPTDIIINQFYFPTWKAQLKETEESLPIRINEETGTMVIAYSGEKSEIILKHAMITQEKIGFFVTFSTIICMLIFAGFIKFRTQCNHS